MKVNVDNKVNRLIRHLGAGAEAHGTRAKAGDSDIGLGHDKCLFCKAARPS